MLPFLTSLLLGSAAIGNTAAPGDVVFAARSTEYAWVVPAGVFEISGLCLGSGGNGFNEFLFGQNGGGGGGYLLWANKIKVTPGETLHIKAGLASTQHGGGGVGSYIRRGSTYLLRAQGGIGSSEGEFHGQNTPLGTNSVTGQVTGGSKGGPQGIGQTAAYAGGGGGAGGYQGSPGDINSLSTFEAYAGGEGASPSSTSTRSGQPGQGGAGGGGGATTEAGYSGGGVGLYGQGANGTAGTAAQGGGGGSGGAAGTAAVSNGVNQAPGLGAGGGSFDMSSNTAGWQRGGNGAVRILWGRGRNNGGRAFPATNVSTSTS